MEPLLREAHLREVRALVGDPAGVDGGHEDAVGLEHLARARASQHVQRGLRHVGVRMPWALVPTAEDALHRRDVDDVLPSRGRRGHRRPQPAHEQEGRGHVRELHFEHLERLDLIDVLRPAVDVVLVGHEPARVDRRARGESLERRRSGGHRLGGERVCVASGRSQNRVRRHRLREGQRVRVVRVPEGEELGERALRERRQLGIHQRLVGAGRTPHRLRGVVDEDVERAVGRHRVGESDDLRRIAQVDADDLQPVDPVGRVGQRGEAADRIAGEARRDRRVRAVAEEPQGDVHADLGASSGQQRALASQVGARVPLLVAHRRALGAELMIEGVDERIRLLAYVAGARLDELAGVRSRGPGGERDAPCLVVDAVGSARRSRGDDGAVGVGDALALVLARHPLDVLVHLARGPAEGDVVRVLRVEVGGRGDHAQRDLELGGVDGGFFGHRKVYRSLLSRRRGAAFRRHPGEIATEDDTSTARVTRPRRSRPRRGRRSRRRRPRRRAPRRAPAARDPAWPRARAARSCCRRARGLSPWSHP